MPAHEHSKVDLPLKLLEILLILGPLGPTPAPLLLLIHILLIRIRIALIRILLPILGPLGPAPLPRSNHHHTTLLLPPHLLAHRPLLLPILLLLPLLIILLTLIRHLLTNPLILLLRNYDMAWLLPTLHFDYLQDGLFPYVDHVASLEHYFVVLGF